MLGSPDPFLSAWLRGSVRPLRPSFSSSSCLMRDAPSSLAAGYDGSRGVHGVEIRQVLAPPCTPAARVSAEGRRRGRKPRSQLEAYAFGGDAMMWNSISSTCMGGPTMGLQSHVRMLRPRLNRTERANGPFEGIVFPAQTTSPSLP